MRTFTIGEPARAGGVEVDDLRRRGRRGLRPPEPADGDDDDDRLTFRVPGTRVG